MDIVSELLEKNKMSKYKLSKLSGVPYSTISDICSGKTDIKKSSAETLVRIAHVFKVKPEDMLGKLEYPSDSTRSEKAKKVKKESNKTKNNENKVDISSDDKNETSQIAENTEEKVDITFVSGIKERIASVGELGFLVATIKANTVINLYNSEQKNESKYLLSLIDDFCKKYNFPICREYDFIRNEK